MGVQHSLKKPSLVFYVNLHPHDEPTPTCVRGLQGQGSK